MHEKKRPFVTRHRQFGQHVLINMCPFRREVCAYVSYKPFKKIGWEKELSCKSVVSLETMQSYDKRMFNEALDIA